MANFIIEKERTAKCFSSICKQNSREALEALLKDYALKFPNFSKSIEEAYRYDELSKSPVNIHDKRAFFEDLIKLSSKEQGELLKCINQNPNYLTFKSWELFGTKEDYNQEMKISLNVSGERLMRVLKQIFDGLKEYNIPFNIRIPNVGDQHKGIEETICIFTSLDNLENIVSFLTSRLDVLRSLCRPLSAYNLAYENIIGFSSYTDEDYKHLISEVVSKAIRSSIFDTMGNRVSDNNIIIDANGQVNPSFMEKVINDLRMNNLDVDANLYINSTASSKMEDYSKQFNNDHQESVVIEELITKKPLDFQNNVVSEEIVVPSITSDNIPVIDESVEEVIPDVEENQVQVTNIPSASSGEEPVIIEEPIESAMPIVAPESPEPVKDEAYLDSLLNQVVEPSVAIDVHVDPSKVATDLEVALAQTPGPVDLSQIPNAVEPPMEILENQGETLEQIKPVENQELPLSPQEEMSLISDSLKTVNPDIKVSIEDVGPYKALSEDLKIFNMKIPGASGMTVLQYLKANNVAEKLPVDAIVIDSDGLETPAIDFIYRAINSADRYISFDDFMDVHFGKIKPEKIKKDKKPFFKKLIRG